MSKPRVIYWYDTPILGSMKLSIPLTLSGSGRTCDCTIRLLSKLHWI